MNFRTWPILTGSLSLAVLLTALGPAHAADQPPPDPTPPPGVEVQARGPVNEAYAEPTDSRPLPSVLVPKQPPDPIEEMPPDEKPAGDNVQWIPGYWGWDDDTNNFLWVSGFWRVPPPARQWSPGHWQAVQGGWQWTAGFWATVGQQQVEYLPVPPPTLDTGAATPAPNENSLYTPGIWVYRERHYLWRPGFWVDFRPNWIWIPAHYVWTPAGYVFVEGYWDHPLEQRGLLFAPVRFDLRVVGPRFVYTPQFVVQADFLIGALFVRANFGHYYFGDFFEPRFKDRGFVAWIDHRPSKGVFDPTFAYYRHEFRGDVAWERNLRDLYAGRAKGTIARPPHTLVEQRTFIKNITVNKTENVAISKNIRITNTQNVSVLAPVTRINNTKVTHLSVLAAKPEALKLENHVIKVERVTKEQKVEVQKGVTAYRATVQQQRQVEAKVLTEGHAPIKVNDPSHAVKIALPQAPTPKYAVTVERPKVVVKEVPKPPVLPKHEERTIPAHEAPKASRPPK